MAALNDRRSDRATFQDDPAAGEEEIMYYDEEPDDWNAEVEAQSRGEQHFAGALSLPFGATTAGRDGEVFHPGFVALRPIYVRSAVCG